MSRRGRTTQSVSLFPFLAVLVCAMGALILLLIVTTQRIRKDALSRAAATETAKQKPQTKMIAVTLPKPEIPAPEIAVPIPEVAAPIIDPNIELQQTLNELALARSKSQQELRTQQRLMLTTQQRVRNSESQLRNTTDQLGQIAEQKQQQADGRKSILAQHAILSQQATTLRQRMKKVRTLQSQAGTKYAFVPFDGFSGTARRPILIECTKQGLRFVPENVVVTAEDLEGFTIGFNPLLAGSRALIQYWSRKGRPNKDPEPYVLLLVRPSGSIAYYTARKLLSSLPQPSGYELLDEDWELSLPDADADAQAVVRHAIDQVLAERKNVIDELAGSKTVNGRQIRFRRNGRGFSIEEVEPDGFDNRSGTGSGRFSPTTRGGSSRPFPPGNDYSNGNSAAGNGHDSGNGQGFGNAQGFGQRKQFSGQGTGGDFPPGNSFTGRNGTQDGDGTKSEAFPPLPGSRSPGSKNSGSKNSGSESPSSGDRDAGKRGSGTGRDFPPGNSFTGRAGTRDGDGTKNGAFSTLPGSKSPGTKNSGLGNRGMGTGNRGTQGSNNTQGKQPNGKDANGQNTQRSQNSNSQGPLATRPGSTAGLRNSGGETARRGNANGSSKPSPNSSGRAPNDRGTSPKGRTPGDPNGFENGIAGTGTQGNTSRNAQSNNRQRATGNTGQSFSGATQGRPSNPFANPPAGLPNSLSINRSWSSHSPARIPKKRHWGLSQPGATIGFERFVTVQSHANRLVIGTQTTLPVGIGETRDELIERVLVAIEQEARSWGPPPGGFYWVPAIRFQISPGGNQYYERLKGPLGQWGLSTSVRFRFDTEQKTEAFHESPR